MDDSVVVASWLLLELSLELSLEGCDASPSDDDVDTDEDVDEDKRLWISSVMALTCCCTNAGDSAVIRYCCVSGCPVMSAHTCSRCSLGSCCNSRAVRSSAGQNKILACRADRCWGSNTNDEAFSGPPLDVMLQWLMPLNSSYNVVLCAAVPCRSLLIACGSGLGAVLLCVVTRKRETVVALVTCP